LKKKGGVSVKARSGGESLKKTTSILPRGEEVHHKGEKKRRSLEGKRKLGGRKRKTTALLG